MIIFCLIFILSAIPVNATQELEDIDNENLIMQPKFTNISVFLNDFDITGTGKAILTSSVNARNVDECEINMYLQRYQNGNWTTIKNWSTRESGTFCGLGQTWYVVSGYQYRMSTFAYVYQKGSLVESTSFTSRSIVY